MPAIKEINGLLIIDKPAGITSHDAVARLRRILKIKKIGHTGTLDPFATGVLVMLIGKATRLARFLDKDEKSYQAVLRFGYETDTGDVEGTREDGRGTRDREAGNGTPPDARTVPMKPDLLAFVRGLKSLPPRDELIERVEAALPEFCGEIEQVPPMYSAKKVKGKKLYDMARRGLEVERKPVKVSITQLSIDPAPANRADNELLLNVTSSAGTYIRTLAEDIGRKTGVPCHLSELRRTRAGRFIIDKALGLDELEQLAGEGGILDFVISMNDAVSHLPEMQLGEDEVRRVANGMQIDARRDGKAGQEIRLTDSSNELVAIGEILPKNTIQPKLVLISN